MKWRLSIGEIVEILGGPPVRGGFAGEITGIADLRTAGPGDLSFLSGGKYARQLAGSAAGVIIVPQYQPGGPPAGQAWLPVPDPSLALAAVCRRVEGLLKPAPAPGIHPTALIDPAAVVDPAATIGPFCVVEADARIGARSVLESHVRVERGAEIGEQSQLRHGVCIGWGCRIGKRCRLFPGAVIGADGFGYHSDKSGHTLLPQIGIVVIEDDVDIGANACIDRARFSVTRVGQGTKIDNLVQVGHNNTIGKHCIVCAQVGMAGSTELGDFVVLAGQVGISGHLKIGDGVTATGQAGITKDVPPGTVLTGTPAHSRHEELRRQVLVKQLPELVKRVSALEAQVR